MLLLLSIVVYLIMYSLRIWMAMFQLHTSKFYYINCSVIYGISSPKKSHNNTGEKKYIFFHECLISLISCLHVTRLLHHSVMLMNEWQSPHCCLSEFPQIMAAKKTEKSVSLTDSNIQTFLEWEENQNVKRKNESYVFSGFGNNGKMVTKRVAV